jgi:tripartite ATP-independent transporter DctP family solute receptor
MKRRAMLLAAAGGLAMPSVVGAQPAGRRLRLAHITDAQSSEGQFAVTFARELAARTGGRWTAEVHPNGALGGQVEMVRGISGATIDLGIVAPLSLGGQIPELEILNVPFIFRDVAHARAVLDGPVGESYRAAWASKELHLIGWGELGLRHMTATRAVPNAAALAGLRLRIPPSPITDTVFRAMGASPGVVPWNQLADALRTGAMQGQENPLNLIITARLNEVQSHLMMTGHTYTANALVASADVAEDLNADDRAHFAAAAQVAKVASRNAAEAAERDGVALLRQRGMTVIETPDMASFRAARDAANGALTAAFGAEALRRIASA